MSVFGQQLKQASEQDFEKYEEYASTYCECLVECGVWLHISGRYESNMVKFCRSECDKRVNELFAQGEDQTIFLS